MADGVKQMGFPKAYAAVKEQRIVRFARSLSDRQGRGIGEVVVVPDDKRVESVFRIETKFRSCDSAVENSFAFTAFGFIEGAAVCA